jgi:branched-chain amino acid transport system permease protein
VVVRSSATIGLLIALIALGLRIFGNDVRNAPDLVSGTVTMGGVRVPYTVLVSLAAAVGLAALVTLGLQRTRVGTRMRAMAERPMTAQLVGIPVVSYTVGAWAATSFMAAIAVVLLAPTFPVAFTDLSMLIGPAVAAALIGGLVDLRIAVAGGVALGVLQSLMTHYDSIAKYQNTLPFVVIVLVLTWAKRDEVWNDAR